MSSHTVRKIHLWVGLILATILLAEAITGLILAQPWIVDQGQLQGPQEGAKTSIEQSKSLGQRGQLSSGEGNVAESPRRVQNGFNALGLAKTIHEGRFLGRDFRWLITLAAIGLIALILSGIYLALPILRARSKRR